MSAPSWPELKADHPIITLFKRLPEIFAASEGYSEVWGIELVGPNPVAISPTSSEPPVIAEEPVPETKPATEDKPADATVEAIVDDKPTKDKTTPTVSDTGDKITPTVSASDDKPAAPVEQPAFTTSLILQKFLRANANSIEKAFSQLKDTLVWRKDFFSPDGEASKGWSDSKFEGIGFTTVIKHKDGKDKVVSWNIYGAAKDIKKTFGTLDEFIRWRVNLMERSLQLLHLKDATEPIPDFGKGADPYQCLQVHDYQSVSFLRLPSEVKTASKKTIQMFARYYPETLERKFFVNVPLIMSWVYLLMKKVVATETMRKLEMIGSGKELASWVGEDIPEPYGGKAQALGTGENDTAISPRDVDAETAAAAAVEAAKKEEEAKVEEAKKAEEAKEEAAKAAPATEETVAVVESVKEVAVSPETATPAETPAVATPAEGVVEGPKTIEPLQLTEPVTTAPVVVAVVEKE